MKFLSQLLTAVSGSVGGCTFAKSRTGGMFIRARNLVTQPATLLQTSVRNNLSASSYAYSNDTTSGQRAGWRDYAGATPLTGPLGQPVKVNAIEMFNRANTLNLLAGIAINTEPPGQAGQADTIDVTASGADASANTISVTFSGSPSSHGDATARYFVFAGRPTTPAQSFYKGPWRFAGSITGTSSSFTGTSPYPVSFVPGQSQFYYVRQLSSDNRVSPTTKGAHVIAA